MADNSNTFGLGPLDRVIADYESQTGLGQALQNGQRGIAADQSAAPNLDAPASAPRLPAQPAQAAPQMDMRQPDVTPSRSGSLLPPPALVPVFQEAATKYQVPVNVLMALAQQESNYNALARGDQTQWGRAQGMLQYLPSTARARGINPYDPVQSINSAAEEIRGRLDKGYSMDDAVKEHFAGPDRKLWGSRTAQYGVSVLGKARKIGAELYPEQPQQATAPDTPLMQGDMDATESGMTPAAPAAPQDASFMGNMGDVGRSLKIGANIAAQDFRELASKILPKSAIDAIDSVDRYFHPPTMSDLVTGKQIKNSDDLLKRDTETMTKAMTPQMQASMQKHWWDDKKGTFGDAWKDWRAYTSGVLQSAPEMAATMAPSMLIARGVYATRVAAGAVPKVAAAAAARAAAITGAVSEGALGGAQSSRQVRDKIMEMPQGVLDQSDAYQTLIQQGKSAADARSVLAEDAASRAFVTAGVATGLFGGMGDRAIAKIVGEGVSGGVMKRILSGAAKGVVGEGIFEELPQSALQQVAENEAVQTVNPKQSLTEDVANQALGGLATGAFQGGAMGGAAGVISHAPAEQQGQGTTTSRGPDGVLRVDMANESPAPRGPLSRAVQGATDEAAARRVIVTTPQGTMTGFLNEYQPAEGGGFVARVLGDDGQTYQFTHQDDVSIRPEAAGPAALPAPTIEVDSGGNAATTAQRQAMTEDRAARDTVDARRREQLGLTPDVERAVFAHRERNGEERTDPETGEVIEPQRSDDNKGVEGDVEAKAPSDKVAPAEDSIVEPAEDKKVEVEAPPPDTKTAPNETDYSSLSLDDLVARRQYLSEQARGNGGWDKRLTREKKKIENAIKTIDPTSPALEQFKPPRERMPDAVPFPEKTEAAAAPAAPEAAAPEQSGREAPAPAVPNALTPRDTSVATPQGKALLAFEMPDGERVLVRKDQFDEGQEKLAAFDPDTGLRKTGPRQQIQRKNLRSISEAPEVFAVSPEVASEGPEVSAANNGAEIAPAATEAPRLSEPAAAPPKAAVPAKKKPTKKEAAEARRAHIEDHFTPGNIVSSYGGADRVISFEWKKDDDFSAKVQAVRREDDQWVPAGDVRTHGTPPDRSNRVIEQAPAEAAAPEQQEPVAPPAKPEVSANTIFTDDAAEKARAVLRAKLKGQLNTGIDPEVMQAGITLAGYHIEKGARTFSAYARAMIEDMGDGIRPYLKSWYAAISFDPRATNFDGMTPISEVQTAEIEPTEAQNDTEAATADAGPGDQGPGADSVQADAGGGEPSDLSGKPDRADLAVPERRQGANRKPGRQPATAVQQPIDFGADAELRLQGSRGNGVEPGDRANRQPATAARNYRIGPGELKREGSWKDTAARNVDVVELVKRLDAEGRIPTQEEKALLSKFTGWGASELANGIFPDRYGNFKPGWKDLGERLKAALTPEEYEQAKRTTQYAHYTSQGVIQSIYDGLARLGFKGGQIVEPGMGVGLFNGLMPAGVATNSTYTGIEYDGLTGAIAKHLYPESNIIVGDYTKTSLPKDFFDAAIGNPPFSSTKITNDPEYKRHGFMLHDYFFAKTMDRVKPGGVVVFVTSKGTMDKASSAARKYLADRANLIGAVRLPQTAFKDNAGTEVVTDVLFLQKRGPGIEDNGVQWLNTKDVKTDRGEATPINEYFADHPGMVLGTHSLTGSMYRANEYTVLPREGDIEQHFADALGNLPENIFRPAAGTQAERAAVMDRDFNPKVRKEGGVYVGDDGRLMQVEDGSGVEASARIGANGKEIALKPAEKRWLKSYVGVRDALKQAQYDQLTDGDWQKSLTGLNAAYDAFVAEHGPILSYSTIERQNPDGSVSESKRFKNKPLFEMDAEGALAYAMERIREDGEIEKGVALRERVLRRDVPPQIETTNDALFVSLNKLGRLDIDDVARLAGKSREDAIGDLGTAIYEDPGQGWQQADAYLSGNVRRKLDEARASAEIDKRYQRNVEALLAVQPRPLGPTDITVRAGANWVPTTDYQDFAKEILGEPMQVIYTPQTGDWGVATNERNPSSEWATTKLSAAAILDSVLNSRQIRVTYVDEEKKTHVDAVETEKANDVARKMRAAFQRWVWGDAARAERLSNYYNEHFNNIAPRQYDGSHLTLPGVSLRFNLYPHQKRAIWRNIQDGDTYLAHAVGSGKTFTMIAAGMEQRRLGLIRRPWFTVPNHMLAQFSREFLELYPTASIMVADEQNFHTGNRRRFLAQASLNDPDAVVITHSAFGRVGMSEEYTRDFIDSQIDEWKTALEDVPKEDRITRKQIERRIEQLERRLDAKQATEKKDKVMSFEETGADYLYVDEMHEFRKLDFATNQGNIKGIDPAGSQRALDLFMKVQYLRSKKPGRAITGASGTPITNTMGELYTNQRIMAPEQLREDGLDNFDAWAAQYGDTVTALEQNASGGYEAVTRFAKFQNVPELMRRVRSYMDILTSNNLGDLVKRPDVEGGGRNIVVTPSPAGYKEFQKSLEERIKKIRERRGPPKQGDDIILNVIADGRFSAIDMRFVDPTLPADPDSKLNMMLDDVINAYQRSADNEYSDPSSGRVDPIKGSSLIVFSDIGLGEQSAKNRGFNMRDWITKRLTDAGIPQDHIALIRDHKQHAKKERLFADMREGKKRILIGGKDMETGVNVQKRLSDLFHLDAPWFPSSVEQREGRIVRQGNQNQEVGIRAYATKGSYDSTMWGMNARKARFIEQAMNGDDSVRSLDDVSEASSFEMASALASGDERYLKLAGLRGDVERLSRLRQGHYDQQSNMRQDKLWAQSHMDRAEKMAGELRDTIKMRKPIKAGEFEGIVDGTVHDNREEFSKDVFEAFKALAADQFDGTRQIGEIGGFPITYYGTGNGKGYQADVHVDVPGSDPVLTWPIDPAMAIGGIATRAANQVNGLDRKLADVQGGIEQDKKRIEQAGKRLGAPFPEESELIDKLSQLNELEAELAAEGEAAQATPETPPVVHAVRNGDIKDGGAYFSTAGNSTYFDPGQPGIDSYDIGAANIADTSDAGVAAALIEETLKDERLNDAEKSRLQEALDEARSGDPHIDYKLADETPMAAAGKRLGYDGFRVWENDDVGNPSSVFIWNTDKAKRLDGVPGDVKFSVAPQTDTPAFRKWFGDSKVVDAAGNPLVVYHGTRKKFSAFQESRDGAHGRGIYFARDPRISNYWAGATEDDDGTPNKLGGSVMPVYLSLQNPATEDDYERLGGDRAALEAAGFDGIMADSEIVAFRPEQIKSAIGNAGSFDASNPDIRYSIAVDSNRLRPSARGVAELRGQTPLEIRSTPAQRKTDRATLRNQVFTSLPRDTTMAHPEVGAITLNNTGMSKSRYNASDRAKLLTMPSLPEIIRDGAYLGSRAAEGKGNGIAAYHYVARRVNVDGVPLVALVTMEEKTDGAINYYNHTMANDLPGAVPVDTGPVDGEMASYRRPDFHPDEVRSKERATSDHHADIRRSLTNGALGGVFDRLLGNGRIVLHQAEGSLPRSIRPKGAAVQGYTDSAGRIHLAAENLTPQTARAVLLHEAFHAGGNAMSTNPRWTNMMRQLDRYYAAAQQRRADGRVKDGDFWDGALRRVEAAQAGGAVDPARATEEFGAYAIENYDLAPVGIKKWIDTLLGIVKNWMAQRFGVQLGAVTPAQLRAFAVTALREADGSPTVADSTVGGMAMNDGPLSVRDDSKDKTAALSEAINALDQSDELPPDRGDFVGNAIRDMDGWRSMYTRFLAHPRQIASLYREFTPVYQTAIAQHHMRNQIIEDLHRDHVFYQDLPAQSKASVNRVLELGRLTGNTYSAAQLKTGVRNPGYTYAVRLDENNVPHRVRQNLDAQLSKAGDTITLNDAETTAYEHMRDMFDRALDKFRDQTLEEMGMGHFAGQPNAAKAIMDSIAGIPDNVDKRRMQNIAQFISDIEQAKRTGYVPFTRYGDYVVAVKERQANIQYQKDGDTGHYLASNVPPALEEYLDATGAHYDAAEQAWRLNTQQRKDLEDQNETTVYSEKVETGLRDKFGRNSENSVKARQASVGSIPSVKKAIERVNAEKVGDNPNRRIVAFATTKKRAEGGIDMSSLDALAEVAMLDPQTWEAVRGQLAKAVQAGGFRKHFFQSGNVAGYSADFERSMADYVVGLSGYLARRAHNAQWEKTIGDIKGSKLHSYATKYREYVNQPAEELALLRQTGFFLYLAGNVSSAILNATQVPLMTMPFLSMVASHPRAAAEVTRAYKDTLAMFRTNKKTGYDLFDFDAAPEDVKEDLLRARDEGLLLPLQSLEIMGIAGRRSVEGRQLQKAYDTTVQTASLPFTATERLNRIVTFIAANRMAQKTGIQQRIRATFRRNPLAQDIFGGKNFSPYSFAEFAVDETQFTLGKVNRPQAMRNVGTAIFQFKGFMLQFLEAMYRNYNLHGGQGKKAALATLGLMVALSGIWGAPGADDLRKLFEGMYKGITKKDFDVRTSLRTLLYDATGSRWLSSLVDGGLPYTAGADMSRRIGMGNLMPDSRSPTGIPWLDSLISFGGVPADLMIGRPLRMAQQLGRGDAPGALAALLPNFIDNARKSVQWSTDGVRTGAGRMVLPSSEVNPSSVAMKAIGIQPSQVSDVYAYNEAQRRAQSSTDELKRQLTTDYVRAIGALNRNKDADKTADLQAEVQRVIREIQSTNEGLSPDQRIIITRQSLRNALQREMGGTPAGYGKERRQARGAASGLREVFGVQ